MQTPPFLFSSKGSIIESFRKDFRQYAHFQKGKGYHVCFFFGCLLYYTAEHIVGGADFALCSKGQGHFFVYDWNNGIYLHGFCPFYLPKCCQCHGTDVCRYFFHMFGAIVHHRNGGRIYAAKQPTAKNSYHHCLPRRFLGLRSS